ncbi:MAG TPA: hypothetical protein VHR42_10040 [Clostridia bacterium]|nr:hypothetical protein [Clostridia bacterium]
MHRHQRKSALAESALGGSSGKCAREHGAGKADAEYCAAEAPLSPTREKSEWNRG